MYHMYVYMYICTSRKSNDKLRIVDDLDDLNF